MDGLYQRRQLLKLEEAVTNALAIREGENLYLYREIPQDAPGWPCFNGFIGKAVSTEEIEQFRKFMKSELRFGEGRRDPPMRGEIATLFLDYVILKNHEPIIRVDGDLVSAHRYRNSIPTYILGEPDGLGKGLLRVEYLSLRQNSPDKIILR